MKHINKIISVNLLLFILLYGTLLSFAVTPTSWSGKVIEVLDGDIIKVLHENHEETIILAEVDCPKVDQPFGSIAKNFTSYLSLGKIITVKPVGTDGNSHIVAHIILPDRHDLNEDLVEAGLAWVLPSTSTKNALLDKEAQARSDKLGIWSETNPIPPWEWNINIRQAENERLLSNIQETSPLSKDEINTSISQNLKYESDEKDSFVIYRGFVVNFNCLKKGPNFTIHRLTAEQISTDHGEKAKRRSSFFIDDHHLKSCSATNNDYKKSGYDRGHMVPAGDFYWNQLLKNETFVLTNISPQSPNLNRGIWVFLENTIRDRVTKTRHTFYIITGVIYSETKSDVMGLSKVEVPDSFYKIIFDSDNNEMYGFLINNDLDSYDRSLKSYQVSIDYIEKLANEDFFDNLPDMLENSIESSTIYLN
ncbi:MAG: DNA/RNA non-specific endonuclease [Thermodesulfovibrionia bacterium]|nr:DNA/RNA non-specific endonuclease [Thermodesulfovibrionia bacterium]